MKKFLSSLLSLLVLSILPALAQTTGSTGGGQSFDNRQPTMAVQYIIATQGIFPSGGGGITTVNRSDPLLAEIRTLAFGSPIPNGWTNCAGQELLIGQNPALFSLLGTTYGGNGTSTFALPDLRGRVPIGMGQGSGLPNYNLGQTNGTEQLTLVSNNLPSHVHSTTNGNTGSAGSGEAFDNLQPTLAVNYIITESSEIAIFGGNFAPDGWGFCDEQTLLIADHPVLYGYIGTTYGGDGTTTFNLPDLRGRASVATTQGSPYGGVGQNFGADSVTLATNQLPAHTHTLASGNTGSTGGGTAFDNRQPVLALNCLTVWDSSSGFPGELRFYARNNPGSGEIGLQAVGGVYEANDYPQLAAALGATYGGNGSSSVGVPNVGGRVTVGLGQGTGTSLYTIGQTAGQEAVTLTTNQIPAHTHTLPTVPPSVSCPADITTNNTTGQCAQTVAFSATITDGFPAPTLSYKLGSTVITSPYPFPVGTNIVDVTASNGIAPNATCSFTVIVRDTETPKSCVTPPTNMISWLPGDGNYNDIQGTNNGSPSGSVTFTNGKVGQAFSFNGVNQLVSLGDPPGLRLNSNQMTIDGWIRPTSINGDDLYFGKSISGGNDYLLLRQFNQLCGIVKAGGTETLVVGTTAFDPPTNQWTHIALTYDGVTVKLWANGVVIGSTAKTGNLAGSSVAFFIGGRTGGLFFGGQVDEVEVFNRALSTNEIRAIYEADSFGKCKPVVVNNDSGLCSAVVNYTMPVSDNCSGANIVSTPASGSTFAVGTTTVTNIATDAVGNAATNSFRVTVRDLQAPAPNVPSLLTVTGQCSVTLTAPTATDNCSGVITGTTTSSLTYTNQSTNTIQWTYADTAGNVSTQSQTVIVRDTTPPSITCPSNIVVGTDAGQCGATVSFTVQAADNCSGSVNIVSAPSSGSFFAPGTNTVTNTATDAAGNTNVCTFTVTVNDTQAPVPDAASLLTVTGQCSVTLTAPTATDNCSGVITGATASSLTYTNQSTNTVQWTYTDVGGNASTQSQTVIVRDTTPPSITCPSNIVVDTDAGQCGATVSFTVLAADNCSGSVTGTNTPSSGSFFAPGTTTVTNTATDDAGNTSVCTFTVTVQPPAQQPLLNIGQSGTNVVLYWSNVFACYALQYTPQLLSPPSSNVWVIHPGPFVPSGGNIYVTNAIDATNHFFRLSY